MSSKEIREKLELACTNIEDGAFGAGLELVEEVRMELAKFFPLRTPPPLQNIPMKRTPLSITPPPEVTKLIL